MDEKTLEALRGSIAKWEGIVAGTNIDKGGDNCPLCKLFWDNDCDGCPVAKATGQIQCDGSPYRDFAEAETEEDEEFFAEQELDFLKSLLPADPLSPDKHGGE